MKKIFSTLIFVFLAAAASFGKSSETVFSFSLEPQFSLSYEKHGEYLLYDSKEPISYLDWQAFPIIRPGIKTDFSINDFITEIELAVGIPMACGTMYDSDWNADGVKTIYSENDVNLISDFSTSLKLYYDFKVGMFDILPSVQFQYDTKTFKAHDGHGWYGISDYSKTGKDVPWDDDNAKYYPHIGGYSTYTLQTFYTFLGCYGKVSLTPAMTLGVGTYVSPYTYNYTKDNHYKKSGKLSKYAYAEQNIIFYRFKEEITFSLRILKDLELNSEVSAILGGKADGAYNYYATHPFYEDEYYLADTGISASDIYTITAKIGVRKKF